jgi:hypothetical protein
LTYSYKIHPSNSRLISPCVYIAVDVLCRRHDQLVLALEQYKRAAGNADSD